MNEIYFFLMLDFWPPLLLLVPLRIKDSKNQSCKTLRLLGLLLSNRDKPEIFSKNKGGRKAYLINAY